MEDRFKFRAWDKEEKYMIDWDDLFETLNFWLGCYNDDYVILMQSTGLKDKNKKLIYEGDLLQWENDTGVYFEVFYDREQVGFKCCRTHYQGNRCGGYIPSLEGDFRFEIIGNIYENPELLEVK